MKVGVTGASGMLGSVLITQLSKSYTVFATSRRKGVEGINIKWDCFDLTDSSLLTSWLESIKPDLVIHCAAIVDVDFCENNFSLANKLHAKSTELIANYLNSNKGRLIYISTDSVFDGKKKIAYRESDLVSPLNVYAKTKILGEKALDQVSQKIIETVKDKTGATIRS